MARLPPNQQLVASGKWPLVGERTPAAAPPDWTLSVTGLVDVERRWTLPELAAWPGGLTRRAVDIHCVTRWSKLDVHFEGIPLASLLDVCRVHHDARFVRFVANSDRGHSTSLPLKVALRMGTMAALRCDGAPLASEHGGPLRSVVPDRYFYKSVKWLASIELMAEDQLGYWEAEAGYHNGADPSLEQRYAAATLSRQRIREVLAQRDFSQLDLRSLDAGHRDLAGLRAAGAALRDAGFQNSKLTNACFDGANLSNARLQRADLRNASFQVFQGRPADLEGADFRGADLRGAVIREASLFGATFCELSEDSADFGDARVDRTTVVDAVSLETLDATPRQASWLRSTARIEGRA